MIILLSPSKTMNFGDDGHYGSQRPVFEEEASTIIKKLSSLGVAAGMNLFKTSEKLTAATLTDVRTWEDGATSPRAKQALWAYDGDVFDGVDAASFSEADVACAEEHLRVLSGLYGVVRPLDMLQKYRLEMKTTLKMGSRKNLYEFWSSKIADNLMLDKPNFIVNATSEEYMKAIRKYLPEDLKVYAPKFLQKSDKGLRDVTIYTKRSRGAYAGWCIKNRVSSAKELVGYDEDGYLYNKKLSTELEPVFTRIQPQPPK